MRNYLKWWGFFSVSWWVMLFPLRFDVWNALIDPIHQSAYYLITLIAGPIPFHSDSSGMYALLLACPVFGALTALVAFIPFFRRQPVGAWTRAVLTYFLVLILWKYGWIKLIKLQFYLPEPNILYRELGQLSKDIAYWSLMGSSRSYVVFMGIAELVAGSLLVFRRTRFVGLLLALGIFINVVMVNISFDISVKLFSITCLLMIIALLTGYSNQLRQLVQLPVKKRKPLSVTNAPRWLKALVLSLCVMETIYPTVFTGSMNDDTIPRIKHHGAYTIRNHSHWKQLFVHREGYVILENKAGQQLDWKIDAASELYWKLSDPRTSETSFLLWSDNQVIWKQRAATDTFQLHQLPYRELPLLQNGVHPFSDEFH